MSSEDDEEMYKEMNERQAKYFRPQSMSIATPGRLI